MKKNIVFVGIIAVFVILVTTSFVAAGFGDWLKNVITGEATSQGEDVNITIGNNAPRIITVDLPTTTPVEGTVSEVALNFTVEDPNGFGQIDNSTAVVTTVNDTGFGLRVNATCEVVVSFDVNFRNFSCYIDMFFFDNATDYRVNVTIDDTIGASAVNDTNDFTYNQLTAFVLGPQNLTFPGIDVESVNTTSDNDPTLLNNTGNDPIANGELNITATNLHGETDPSTAIFAENFTVDVDTGGSPGAECDGTLMANQTTTAPTTSFLDNGNLSINAEDDTSGQEQLYYCLSHVNNDLSVQSYSTFSEGSWTVSIN